MRSSPWPRLSRDEARRVVQEALVEEVAAHPATAGRHIRSIRRSRGIRRGFSLMAVELRTALEARLGVQLPLFWPWPAELRSKPWRRGWSTGR